MGKGLDSGVSEGDVSYSEGQRSDDGSTGVGVGGIAESPSYVITSVVVLRSPRELWGVVQE